MLALCCPRTAEMFAFCHSQSIVLKRYLTSVPQRSKILGVSLPSQKPSPLAAEVAASKKQYLPKGISLQVLDKRHDINQIRYLLARAFVANNEPIVHALGQLHYPSLSPAERIPLIEERFKTVFSDESLMDKVNDGLSVVAVKDHNPKDVVSVLFVEKYKQGVYPCASASDPLCQTGLNFMRAVHKKALPILEYHDPQSVLFVSHGATHPKYRSMGILEHVAVTCRLLADQKGGFEIAFGITTAERLTQHAIRRFGFHVVSEVFYNEYEENGQKIFETLSDKEVSAKALMAYL